MVSTMADPIYGIHQSQPRDVYNYLKSNAKKISGVGHFNYLPNLRTRAQASIVGLPNGLELVISDNIQYYDDPMMDGRIRRYAKIEGYFAFFGGAARDTSLLRVEDELNDLGYSEVFLGTNYDVATAYAAELGIPSSSLDPVGFNSAQKFYVKAGVATYVQDAFSIMDAPHDGKEYVRVDGEWILSDHFVHANIDGGEATLDGLAAPTSSPSPSPTTVLVNYTPNYLFDGSSYDNSYENYSAGDAVYDTFGIDQISISNSFVTIYFNTTNNRINWSSTDRQVDLQCTMGGIDYAWEGQYTLNASSAYSTNESSNYIHYTLPISSTLKDELADHLAGASANESRISLEFS